MEKLLIIGTGDYAEVASFYLAADYEIIGFSEEAAYRKLPSLQDLPIFNFEDIPDLYKTSEIKILVAVGPNHVNTVRERLFNEIKAMGFECISYIHPSASVWDVNAVGENSFVFPNTVVEPYAVVGKNCVMWSGAMLAHHSQLQDHCFMAPGALVSGRTIIKNNCFLGINSTVRDNLIVEEKCIIGAGSVIKSNTQNNGVYSAKGTGLYNLNSSNTKV